MVDKIETVDDLKKDMNIPEGQELGGVNILFLDISSSCTGYAIANVDFVNKKVKFSKAGAIWLNPDWEHQEKYLYMAESIRNYFWVVEAVDYIVAETYSINPKRMVGVSVVPEMQGAIKSAAFENGVKVSSISPQTWRKQLGIKRNADKDFKEPTKLFVEKHVEVPVESISNITGKHRGTPTDLYDALGVAMGWITKLGFDETKWDFKDIKFNTHVGYEG